MQDFTQEGNEWFKRNHEKMKNFTGDILNNYLESLPVEEHTKVLEIGCSNGYRLARLKANCFGTDISEEAIKDGQARFPQLNLQVAESHANLFPDNFFDVVCVSFVFHWVDRRYLFKMADEINRVLKPGGKLLIQDFFSKEIHSREYHHKEGLLTSKSFYEELFRVAGYTEIYRMPFDHDDLSVPRPELTGGDNDCVFVTLSK